MCCAKPQKRTKILTLFFREPRGPAPLTFFNVEDAGVDTRGEGYIHDYVLVVVRTEETVVTNKIEDEREPVVLANKQGIIIVPLLLTEARQVQCNLNALVHEVFHILDYMKK